MGETFEGVTLDAIRHGASLWGGDAVPAGQFDLGDRSKVRGHVGGIITGCQAGSGVLQGVPVILDRDCACLGAHTPGSQRQE